jgi:Ca-activated chloride channel homolog
MIACALALVGLGLLLSGSRPASAEGDPPDNQVSVIVTGASDAMFPKIAVEFEVERPDGSFLLDAKADDFRITEDNREERILRSLVSAAIESLPTTASWSSTGA